MRQLSLALLLVVTPPAFAEESPPESPPPAAKAETVVDTPNVLARKRDAAIDRGLISTHAETIGAKQWAINAYELFFIGATYGFTDDIQASFSTLMPIVADIPLVLVAQAKFVVHRTNNTVVALRAPLMFASENDLSGGAGGFGAGVVMDHRFDKEGRYTLHGGLLVSGALVAGSSVTDDILVGDGAVISADLGLSLAFKDSFSLIFEGQAFAAVTGEGFDFLDLGTFSYGVRFHSGTIAGDIGFVRPIGVDTDPLILGIPYLAFSARL